MKNLVINLRNATAQAGCAKYISLFLLLTLGVGQMWALDIYLDISACTGWPNDGATIKLWPGTGSDVTGTSVATNLYKFTVTSATGTMYFKRMNGSTKWNEASATYNAAYNLYKLTGWNAATCSQANINTVTKSNYIYFVNNIGWTNTNKYFVIGHDQPTAYSKVYSMSSIAHTQLLYVANTTDNWTDATYYAFCATNDSWSNGSWGSSNLSNATKYTGKITAKKDLASGKYYLYDTNGSSSNGATLLMSDAQTSYTANKFKTTLTAYRKVLASGQTNFASSSSNSVGTVSVSGYAWSSKNSTSSTSASIGDNASASITTAITSEITLTAVPGAGYVFAGWYSSAPTTLAASTPVSTDPTYTYNIGINSGYNIHAGFIEDTPHDVTIRYRCTSPSKSIQDDAVRAIGELMTSSISAPDIPGYTFSNWTVGSGIDYSTSSLTANPIVVKAKASGSYVITANYTEDLTSPFIVTGGNKIVTSGTAWRTTADANNKMTKKTGYSSSYDAYFTVSVTAVNQGNANNNYQFKLYNTNTSTHYGLTGTGQYYLNRSESGTAKAMSTPGINVELRADALGEYEIKVNYSSTPTLTVTYPTAYTMTYSIGSVAGTSGSISAKYGTTSFSSGTKIQSGKSVTLTAPEAKTGCTWKGWYTDADGTTGKINDTNRAITVTMDANKTLYACYTENTFNVRATASPAAGGTVTPTSNTAMGQITGGAIVATKNTGYTFSGWSIVSGSGYFGASGTSTTSSTASTKFRPTAASTLLATFTESLYSVTVSSNNTNFGTVSPTSVSGIGITTASGTIKATPVTGATFTSWTIPSGVTIASGSTSTPSITINATANKTITANFAETMHAVTLSSANTAQGTVSASPSVGQITAVQIKATPKTGFMFAGWVKTGGSGTVTYHVGTGVGQLEDATGASKATTYITVTGDVTLQATWDEDRSSGYYLRYGNDGKDGDGNSNSSFAFPWTTDATDGVFYKKSGETASSVSYFTLTCGSADVGKVYEFKVTDHTNWYGYSTATGGKIEAAITNQLLSTSYGNGRLCIVMPGDYVFQWNSSTKKLSIAFPTGNYVRGDFNSWGWGDVLTPTGNANELSCTVSLAAGQTWTAPDHGFKVVINGVHYGKNSTSITRASNAANSCTTSGTNIGLTTDVAGNYTFTVNTSSKNVTVTYPAAYRITYNANSPTGGSAPAATAYYVPGSNVILATNAGNLYKTGYSFKGWNTANDGSGTSYAPEGTYSNIQSDVTLYAEWVEDDHIMYYYNNNKWGTVKAHIWHDGTPEWSTKGVWPGSNMTSYKGTTIYEVNYASSADNAVVFNNGTSGGSNQTADLTIADGQSGNYWFYNDQDKTVNTGGIYHGWSQYIMVADFPTTTVAAVVGEKVTISPLVVWADGINFTDINISATRVSGGSTNVNAIIAGTDIIVSGTASGPASFDISYQYLTSTITKRITVKIVDGITIQAKVPTGDTKWISTNNIKIHYWGNTGQGVATSDVTMKWIKNADGYNYYQTSIPVGDDSKINFLFFYEKFVDSEPWRKTQDILNVTTDGCYEITRPSGLNAQRTATRSGNYCVDSWQVQITMGSGDIFTSNIVENSTDIVSFFAPSNANESQSYRRGTVTLEHNGTTVATIAANTFSASGVYTAKINTSNNTLTDVNLYTGNYYIRTDESAGGWNNYKTTPSNKMIRFNRNPNFPNETFSYYWVDNIAKTSGGSGTVNIKATVANDYNPVLCNFSADDNVAREEHGLNLRFGYEPTTNDLIRGILKGATFDDFLNLIGYTGNIFKEIECETEINEAFYTASDANKHDCKMQDKSNWIYEIIVYTKIDAEHKIANVVLKSKYNGTHYLLGMQKDASGHETGNPVQYPIIRTGTTYGIYGLRVIYDFKTNRLFGAWAPANRVVDGVLNVDADIMFLRHEDGDAAQIGFNTTNPSTNKITSLRHAIFALELDNEETSQIGGRNMERHYFFSLPFNCRVGDIFGIGGYMEYWGIQRYRGDLRAQKGWFKETRTFWEWLGEDFEMQAGEGYLISVDKDALERDGVWKGGIIYQTLDTVKNGSGEVIKAHDGTDSVAWVTHDDGSLLTLYFPSTSTISEIKPADGGTFTKTYPDQPCSITRDDRNLKDSNWKCMGAPGYKNINMSSYNYTASSTGLVWNENTPPRFLYDFVEQTSGAVYAKGTYEVKDGSTWDYHAFHAYMTQFSGTIDWTEPSLTPPSLAPRRMPREDRTKTELELNLISEENEFLDRTFVWLQEEATTGFDQNYDLNKMIETNANQIYSLAEHNVPFAANVLPLETDTVALVVNIANTGDFTFAVDSAKHIGMAPVLYDSYQNEHIDLLSADYTVNLAKGKYDDRFYLIFNAAKPILTDFESTEDGGHKTLSNEAIYDVLGRRVNTIYPGHLYIVNGEKRILW